MRLLTIAMFCLGSVEVGKSAFSSILVEASRISRQKAGAYVVEKMSVGAKKINTQKQMHRPRSNCRQGGWVMRIFLNSVLTLAVIIAVYVMAPIASRLIEKEQEKGIVK